MSKIISVIALVAMFSGIFAPISLSAATGDTIALEITANTTGRVGEAMDITVRAVDKDKKTVTGYRGSVIFNTDNIWDTVPAPGKTVAFTADDNGEKKFSKALIFKKSGKQKVYVSDVSDDIIGEATISVDPAAVTTPTLDQNVTIITPENDTKITGDMLMVSGKTRKNSKITLMLNGQAAGTVVSDDSGIFTKNLTGLTQENNILVANLIDGTNTTISSSPEIRFGRVVITASMYGVVISPSATVESSSPIEIIVDATPDLAEITVSLDGSILTASEDTTGKYSIKTVAPQKWGTYKLMITQKDSLGQSKTFDSPTSLTVTENLTVPTPAPTTTPIPTFKNVKTTTEWSRVVFDFAIENAPSDMTSFKIAYGKNADSLTQEVTTLTIDKIASKVNSGSYTWYIDKVPTDTYTFKIFGRTASGTLISGLVSEPIVATLGKDSCTIGNVAGLTVATDASKSIISWTTLTGATSYNLYKVSAAGDYSIFQNTKESNYTLYLSSGAVTYENFVVKALCDDSTESKEYSSMSRVQSGPGMVAIIVIISAIFGALLMRRRFI